VVQFYFGIDKSAGLNRGKSCTPTLTGQIDCRVMAAEFTG
jgi:hypothetical protein